MNDDNTKTQFRHGEAVLKALREGKDLTGKDGRGVSDLLINIPSMLPACIFSVWQELMNSAYGAVISNPDFKNVPLEHSH